MHQSVNRRQLRLKDRAYSSLQAHCSGLYFDAGVLAAEFARRNRTREGALPLLERYTEALNRIHQSASAVEEYLKRRHDKLDMQQYLFFLREDADDFKATFKDLFPENSSQ